MQRETRGFSIRKTPREGHAEKSRVVLYVTAAQLSVFLVRRRLTPYFSYESSRRYIKVVFASRSMAHLTGRSQVVVYLCDSPRGGAKSLAKFCVCPHKQAGSREGSVCEVRASSSRFRRVSQLRQQNLA